MPPHKYISKAVLFDDDEELHSSGRYDASGRPRSLQELRQRRQQALDSTLQTTRSALMLLRQAEDTGISAATELHRQGEVLRHAQGKLEQMDANLKKSKRHISSIESVFKGLKKRITGKSKKSRRDKKKNKSDHLKPEKITIPDEQTFANIQNLTIHSPTIQNGTIQIDDPNIQDKNAMIESDLVEIANAVSRLKDVGVDMLKETNAQNSLLDKMYENAERTGIDLRVQTKRVEKLTD